MREVSNTILSICILTFFACNSFNKEKATEKVYLTDKDLHLYQVFYKLLLQDSTQIRQVMEPIFGTTRDNMIHTGAYHLFQFDSLKYSQIIYELKRREIYSDGIVYRPNGIIVFRLKEMYDLHWDDYNDAHIHELVIGNNPKEHVYKYVNVVMDSTISDNMRYVYFTDKTGH